MHVAVIGRGLFGSIIGATLAKHRVQVTWIDDNRPMIGSKPAACLIKPSWLSSMTTQQIDDALDLLDNLYGVLELDFALIPPLLSNAAIGTTKVKWVNPGQVLTWPGQLILDTALDIKAATAPGGGPGHVVFGKKGAHGPFDRVIVCTGYWAGQELVNHMHGHAVKGQTGCAMLWHEPQPRTIVNQIKVWAPYKQLVAFNRGDGHWCGDGSAIIPSNWTFERQLASQQRAAEFVQRPINGGSVLVGIRPYVKLEKKVPCLVEELRSGLWLATGGAKNGTMAAAWAAERIRDQL